MAEITERRRTLLRDQHRHAKRWQQLRVTTVEWLDEMFVRVVFDYGRLKFESHGFDDVLVLYFPTTSSPAHLIPDEGSSTDFESREYTVQCVNPSRKEVTVDFLIHQNGIATQWARRATPGQLLWCIPPRMCKGFAEAQRTYLFADPSALPAVRRFHREEGSTSGETVLAGFSPSSPALSVPGNRRISIFESTSDTAQLLAATDIAEYRSAREAFVWIAGEAQWAGQLRRALIHDVGIAKENIQFTGYWRSN